MSIVKINVATGKVRKKGWSVKEREVHAKILQDRKSRETYSMLRQAQYPAIGDQLDALLKQFAEMADQGLDLSPALAQVIDDWRAVKERFPKSG